MDVLIQEFREHRIPWLLVVVPVVLVLEHTSADAHTPLFVLSVLRSCRSPRC
jgi:hypothetical protein